MKRILIFILAICLSLPLVACDKDNNGGDIKGDAYTAHLSHLYPYASQPHYDNDDYSVVVDGDKAELVQIAYESDTNDDGAYTAAEKTKMTGTVKLEDGYYVITVKKLYNSVKISGAGANTYKNEMIQNARDAIADIDKDNPNYKNYVARYELMIDLYSGKEVDATSMTLSEFESVVYKVKFDDKNGKITEMLMFADGEAMGGYTFEYGENGVMTRSTEFDNDNDLWETEYRANGTPSFFKYTTEEEVMAFTCDENGTVTEIAED